MSGPEDWPEEKQEETIRPIPRPPRAAAPAERAPETSSGTSEEPLPWAEFREDSAADLTSTSETSGPRPDRTRIHPVSWDRDGAHELNQEFEAQRRTFERLVRVIRVDRWLAPLGFGAMAVLLGLSVWWIINKTAIPVEPEPVDPAVQARIRTPLPQGGAALQAVEAFLAAPDALSKSAFVLDSGRVLTLMQQREEEKPSQSPEPDLILGVPEPAGHGLIQVPARTAAKPVILFHFLVKETGAGWKVDWETFDQEWHQRFQAFASTPGSATADFRLELERAHVFGEDAASGVLAVRVSPPGGSALADPYKVAPGGVPDIMKNLPWNVHRRALVRLEWASEPGKPPAPRVKEVVRWDFPP